MVEFFLRHTASDARPTFSTTFDERVYSGASRLESSSLLTERRRILRILSLFIFLLSLAAVLAFPTDSHSRDKRHILVLNSYHKGMSWTDNIERGLASVLGNEGRNIELHFEYLDAKRYHGRRYLQKLHETFIEKFRAEHFDVVIAADNDAFDFIRKHRRELFPYTPVVFCGVNDYDDSMIAGLDYITGVVEDTDVKSTIEVALRLHPKTRQIVVLGDMTTTGIAIRQEVRKVIPRFKNRVKFVFLDNFDFEELPAKVRGLGPESVILLTVANRDRKGAFLSYEDSLDLLYRASKVPIYSIWDFYLGRGIVGGMLTSGFYQGRTAARMALRIADGENVRNIPVVKESPNRYMFDHRELARFAVRPSDLPEGSVIINEPSSFFELHKTLLWGMIAGFGGLTVIIMLLLANMRQRRRGGEALRRSEENYRTLVNNVNIGIYRTDPGGGFLQVNPAMVAIAGYASLDELLQVPVTELYYNPDDRNVILDELKRNRFLKNRETRFKKKDGTSIWASIFAAAHFDEKGEIEWIDGVIDDVTARKHAEEALTESKERMSAIAESSMDAIIMVNEDGIISYFNPAAERMFGYAQEEALGRPLHGLIVSEEAREKYYQALPGFQETGECRVVAMPLELNATRRDGTRFPAEVSIVAMQIRGRWHSAGTVKDITERKRVEEALKESETRFRTLVEQSPFSTQILRPDGSTLTVNNAFCDLWGATTETAQYIIGTYNILRDEQLEEEGVMPFIKRGFEGEFVEIPPIRYDPQKTEVIRDAGLKPKWVKGYIWPVKDETGNVRQVVLMHEDITERKQAEEEKKRLEQQLLQSQKMEAVGRLAGGIAHDFNNILTAMISYANLVQMTLPDEDPSKAYVENVLALANRAATLTQGLLAFSRKQLLDQRPVDMNEIVRRVEKFLSRIIGEDIEFRTDLADAPLTVFADAGQMEQVLMNLAANARDAMPQGGLLTITTVRVELDEEFVKMHGYGEPGSYAVVSVSDTGMGMDEKTTQSIFEPFFTTKELGRGTGLGLSIVYGIIKQHNGYIDVYSEIGKGTAFKLYLPFVGAEAEEAVEVAAVIAPRGTETILLAEDEEEVRTTTRIILERFGYSVIEASDGAEAVRKFEEHRDAVQLLLFDVMMPRMNGREAYEEIRKRWPGVKAVFISGYTADIIYQKGLLEEGLAFVPKPISPTALLIKIREVLGK